MSATIAKILSRRSHIVPGRTRITEFFFEVPRDYTNPTPRSNITLFGRSASRVEKPADPSTPDDSAAKPWLLFLQGGPGFGNASPENSAWVSGMLERGYQVLCLDQRGTGLSSALTASTLGLRGDEEQQATHMRSFRADSIVRDCEAVRLALLGGLPEQKRRWSVMGQSFGGFCAVTYLSFFPEGVREAFLFGGLPPLVDGPDEVYRRTVRKVIERNEAYYAKYPEDVERVRQICGFLQKSGNTTVRDLSQEGYLTARRFLQIGILFGGHGGLDTVHDLVLRAHNDLKLFGHITRPTIARLVAPGGFDEHIIYTALHEPIYCQGKASNWSCDKVLKEHADLFTVTEDGGTKPIYFTGEMIFPWMLEDYGELRRIAKQTKLVQEFKDWPALYDEAQLAKNQVPVYAAVYMDDMYVDFDFSMATARKIKGCKPFVTNMMYHDAVRSKVDDVLKAVFALRDDTID